MKIKPHKYTAVSYYHMKERCYDIRHKDYHNYGGRGITVCDSWLYGDKNMKGVRVFIKDMGIRPQNKTLDRIDGNKNYCKENCRWVTRKEQMNNIRLSKDWKPNSKNTSGHRGVTQYVTLTGNIRYTANLAYKKKINYLGSYRLKSVAIKARLEAEKYIEYLELDKKDFRISKTIPLLYRSFIYSKLSKISL